MNPIDDAKQKRPVVPKGYDTESAFLQEMREYYDNDLSADEHNRLAAIEDIQFTFGDQWDETVATARRARRKPVLTVNRLPAYVAQIVNNRLLNETEIRVLPDRDGTKEVAEVRQGLIRSIFKNSTSDFARDEAMKYQVICGIGGFEMCPSYESDDTFDQHIEIKPIVDPLAVVWDAMSVLPCGGDATHAFVCDSIPTKVFKKRYPWAAVSDFDVGNFSRFTEWFQEDAVQIVSYWRMIEDGEKTIALMVDGTTKEIDPKLAAQAVAEGLIAKRADGSPYIKTVPRKFAERYLCSGANILEGPYRLPITSIPVYRVPGWELREGNRVNRWGLVRFLKDPQRLHNYWRSTIAEQLVAAPRNKWVATKDAVTGHEKEWQNSHLSDDPLLIYNSEGGKPERVAPSPADAGLLTEAANTVQDIRDVSNIHEASLGMKSNEVSGKAIQARQQMTDLASFIYHDRLRLAEERCAKNINELIPVIYDTTRMLTVLGPDDKALQVVINDPSDPNSDITIGKYGLTVTTGPATVTKRALVKEEMAAVLTRMPDQAGAYMDLWVDLLDVPNVDAWKQRAKAMLPPGLKGSEDMTPEEMQQAEAAQQEAMLTKQVELRKAMAEIGKDEAEIEERKASAMLKQAQAYKAISDADSRAEDVAGNLQQRDFDAKMKFVETALTASEREEEDDDAGNPGE